MPNTAHFAKKSLWLALGLLLSCAFFTTAFGQTIFEVNSLGDEPLQSSGSISCFSTASNCTLRAALQAANNRSGAVEIRFTNMPSSSGIISSVLFPASELPGIQKQVTIAGNTHPQWSSTARIPRVVIRGDNVGGGTRGLVVLNPDSAGTVIRGISIANFTDWGVHIFNTSNVRVEDSRIGLFALNNSNSNGGNSGVGFHVENSSNVSILDNWISANGGGGIDLTNGTSSTLIAGNRIGLRTNSGSLTAGNDGPGVNILPTAGANNAVGRCLPPIGTFPGFCRGNTIVSNASHGVHVQRADQSVVFNVIGFNGNRPTDINFGNTGDGVRVEASNVTISNGAISGAGNLIGFNEGDGVRVISGQNISVLNNFIGGDGDGGEFGNIGAGIRILAGGDHTVSGNLLTNNGIGIVSASGPTSILNNEVIANDAVGMEITDWHHFIEGNVVGSHSLMGIALGYAASVSDSAVVRDNWVGVRPNGDPIGNANGMTVNWGTAVITSNTISGNAFNGLSLISSEGSIVRSNFIGILPDGTARGNGHYGIYIEAANSNFISDGALIGYTRNQTIPAENVPDGSGGGGTGNIIAHNGLGLRILRSDLASSAERIPIRGNRFYGNADGAVQLFSSIGGVNEGAGEGPNRLLNHPQLDDNATFFDSDSGTVEYRVLVPTLTSAADYPLRLDFYITNPGESQGRFFIGTAEYPAAAANTWVSGSLSPVGSYSLNDAMIVAMATDTQGNSSEFSASPADLSFGAPSPIDNIVISSFGDAPNADLSSTSCDTGNPFIAPGVPNCTLRAAIQAANNHSDPVTITFWEGLPAPGGVSTFAPGTQLPAIGSEVTLAGETHASFSAANGPAVQIAGTQQSTGHGLIVSGNNSVIRHVAITGFPQDGLRIQLSGSVLVHDSLIGLAPSSGAFVADGNGRHGVVLTGASGNELRDNWISANTQRGVQIDSGSAGNILVGNRIGAGRDGGGNLAPAGNGNVGVIAMGSAGFNNQIGRCVINLPDPNPVCSGNLIVANGSAGISITGGSQVLASNWVGVNPNAPQDESFGNGGAAGIVLASNGNELRGGLQIGAGSNVVGHSAIDGILITADGNQLGNVLVGITPAGDDVGNGGQGIRVESGRDNLIAGSRISNNVNGVVLMDGPNTVSNNRIVDNQNSGVMVVDGGQWIDDNVIGGHGLVGIFFGHSVDASADGLLRITANRIGVDTDGEIMANQVGIWGLIGGRANIGEVDGLGNVIAGNQNAGVVLDTTSNARIVNNHIGVLPDGSPAGNGGAGVSITTSSGGGISLQNVVGYPATLSLPAEPVGGGSDARGNVIANHLVGVIINSNETDPVLLRNSLRGNRFLNNNIGVQLGESAGGTDPGGGQQGPNRLQNPPEFDAMATFFDENSGQVEFSFRVDTLASNASFPIRVDFYLAAGSQGDVYLHTETYGSGDATQFVSGSFTPPAGLDLVGASMVGMATDDGGNSSEFSAPVSLGELTDELFSDRFE